MNIETAANLIKKDIEVAITQLIVNGSNKKRNGELFKDGLEAKTSLIRSSTLINHIHEFIKKEMQTNGINSNLIYPPIGETKPEIKVTGMFKQKDQDVCAKPNNIKKKDTLIGWGPLDGLNLTCPYGKEFTEKILSVNIRSQLSSLAKNADTLFERMFAEALNLHTMYPQMIIGEVFVIPVYEYDDAAMKENKVSFKKNKTNLEKYINFFHFLNGRNDTDKDEYKYERCALVIIDFKPTVAKVYKTTQELKADNLVNRKYNKELGDISTDKFINDLLKEYQHRFKSLPFN